MEQNMRRRGRWGGGGGPHRMRRGDIRTAVLAVLAEQPGHGYEVIQSLEEKSGGAWRPSPGSIYPTLQLLEDEGLVRSQERDGKRVYELTDAGREESAKRLEDAGGPPWKTGGPDFRGLIGGIAMAYKQVQMAGSPTQVEQATEVLRDARRQLYRLLADD